MRQTSVSPAERQQKTVYFSGLVQGVGFRYTTHRLAGSYHVVGSVRNLRDGRVDAEEIERFLDEIRQHFSGNIRNEGSSTARATGSYHSFSVIR